MIRPILLTLCLLLWGVAALNAATPLRALIVDGQNNHAAWPKTTVMMKRALESTGRFEVEIARTRFTWRGDKLLTEYPLAGVDTKSLPEPVTDPDFSPEFHAYDVVVNNLGHGAAPWPDATQARFVAYMRTGGGLVSVHAADNCWPDWPEYNEMIGLGGWGGRNERSGPYVYYNDSGGRVRDRSPGRGGGHGPQHEFQIVAREPEHPILRGLPPEWLHAKDELYERLRGPAENLTVLATAYASPQQKGSGRHEPILMTIRYGEGRVFHTTLGHADYSMQCVGFLTTFTRGAEWAATGAVTQGVVEDFPKPDTVSSQPFEAAAGR